MSKINDYEFVEICKESNSMLEASQVMNIPLSSFIRRAKKLGCYKTNQFWSKGKNIVSDSRLFGRKIEEIFVENSNRKINKNALVEIKGYKCECCNISKWLNKSIVLEVDHINGIHNDNRLENLRLLCPNCHSQTDTYRGKNIKKRINKDGNYKYTDNEIKEAIINSFTITEVCLKLNLTPKGGNYKTIKNKIEKLDIKLKEVEKKVIETKECKCGSIIRIDSPMCRKCYDTTTRKTERPTLEVLLNDVKELGYKGTGKKYNVSDNAIRKWIKSYQK